MKTFKMNNGLSIPCIGSGTNTYGKVNRDYMGEINGDTSELDSAIALGYRHFDTAISYRNEAVVGEALKKSGRKREEFFITTKVPGDLSYLGSDESVNKAVEESLKKLQVDTIDLLLIHHPLENNTDNLLAWQSFEKLVDEGKVRSIGVSNFNVEQLDYILQYARIKPVLNQIESHPGNWNDEIIMFCLEKDILPEAWGPLKRISEASLEVLERIAQKHQKTWAQIVLAYQIGRGVVVIPKSHNPSRQKENLDIFDINLSEEETSLIATL